MPRKKKNNFEKMMRSVDLFKNNIGNVLLKDIRITCSLFTNLKANIIPSKYHATPQ